MEECHAGVAMTNSRWQELLHAETQGHLPESNLSMDTEGDITVLFTISLLIREMQIKHWDYALC